MVQNTLLQFLFSSADYDFYTQYPERYLPFQYICCRKLYGIFFCRNQHGPV